MEVEIDFTGFCQKLLLDGKPFLAKIFDGEGSVPEGFNVIRIVVDASMHSLLNWSLQIEMAKFYSQRGLFILWELQCPLSDDPLEKDVQFISFQLAIEHFVEKIWPAFQGVTFGLALYRGVWGISHCTQKLQEIKLLSSILPDPLSCFLFLDLSTIDNPSLFFQVIARKEYGHLKLFLKSPCLRDFPYALPVLGWGHGFSVLGYCSECLEEPLQEQRITTALCFPEYFEGEFPDNLKEIKPLRVIAESLLHQQWEGIDRLILFPDHISENGWRKIRGFIAAGGTTINYPNAGASLPLQGIFPASFLTSLS